MTLIASSIDPTTSSQEGGAEKDLATTMAQPAYSPTRLAKDLTFLYQAEAKGLFGDRSGYGAGTLASADLSRYRRMAEAAVPQLTDRQWGLLSHILDGAEFARLVHRDDGMPSSGEIAAGIMDWMRAGGSETAPAWARQLYDQARAWSPLTIAGILFRLRGEAARKVDAEADEAQ